MPFTGKTAPEQSRQHHNKRKKAFYLLAWGCNDGYRAVMKTDPRTAPGASSTTAREDDQSDNAPDDLTDNFIEEIIEADLRAGKHGGHIVTRFPPEPNGCLHIGHAKAICLNFSLAAKYNGQCNLRFDDTNPTTEDTDFVEAIKEDVHWLGFDWKDKEFFASGYFPKLYDFARTLINTGHAYVDSQSLAEIRENRGNYYKPGIESPYRDRSVAENLDLFTRMRAGEFDEGAHVLRAKIDMQSSDILMRDPLLYRIHKTPHHRTGTEWPIYPMYDFAHGLSDSIERVTHSICTLEFQNNRPLYNWFLETLDVPHKPQQIEFARLNLTSTVLSKRVLQRLVHENHVTGWNDPRMPTLSGLRRRGYTPEAIRAFCDTIGVARRDGRIELALLEHTIREHLNATSPRVMSVLRPLRLVIENYPEGNTDFFTCPVNPEDPAAGTHEVPFSRVLYVERDDFLEDPPKKWFRLTPGREVRLRYACLVTCKEAIKDPNTGEIVELRCEWDPASRGGASPDGRKVRGTIHWVSAAHAFDAEVRLYDRLFAVDNPLAEEHGNDLASVLNPDSLEVLTGCKLAPSLKTTQPGTRLQFERLGYFCADTLDSTPGHPVFNRTIGLRDSWAKIAQKQSKTKQAGRR